MQTMILLTAKAVTKFVWNFTWVFFFGKVAVKDAMVTNRKATLLFFCFIGSVFYSAMMTEYAVSHFRKHHKLVEEMRALGCIKEPSKDPLRKIDKAVGAVVASDAASVVVTVEEEKPKAAKSKKKVANDGVSK
jgi:hypothetical protein